MKTTKTHHGIWANTQHQHGYLSTHRIRLFDEKHETNKQQMNILWLYRITIEPTSKNTN